MTKEAAPKIFHLSNGNVSLYLTTVGVWWFHSFIQLHLHTLIHFNFPFFIFSIEAIEIDRLLGLFIHWFTPLADCQRIS